MRIVIVGGPRRGKSTLARSFDGHHVFCGDPHSKVKEPEDGIQYAPEGLDFAGDNGAGAFFLDWLERMQKCDNWVLEGHVTARALRRWKEAHPFEAPCHRIIVLSGPAKCEATKGQDAMHKGVMKVWEEIAHNFRQITEYR